MNTKINILTFAIIISFTIFSLQIKAQNALNFDGTNDRVDCGNSAASQISGTHITLEAWIKPSSFGPNVWSNNIIDKEVWSPQNGYMLRCGSGGKLNFNLGNTTSSWHEITSTNNVLSVNVWAHVAATYDGSYMRLYVNGICTDSLAKNISFVDASNSNLVIGDYSGGGRYYAGNIDEVRIWNVTRTKAQIQADMNHEICGGITGLKLYFRFDQGVAAGNNSSILSAINSATNGTNANLSGFALSGTSSNFVVGKTLPTPSGASNDSIYATICQGDYYLFGNQHLTNSGTYQAIYSAAGGCDSIVHLFLTVNPSSLVQFFDTICQGETYIFGNQHLTQSGDYYDTLQKVNSCDSILKLSLYVRYLNMNMNVINGISIHAFANGVNFQWLDCDSNFAKISGATSQNFYPTVNGNYAVIISDSHCTDTSICYAITMIDGIQNYDNDFSLSIRPNPSQSSFVIHQSGINQNYSFKIYNSINQCIIQNDNVSNDLIISNESWPNGIYFILIKTKNQSLMQKIIKD
ncbi:MAG: hypothetical protein AUJ98_04585 [Bacteroidetes bacterium CG2_30_33_31]|nr:MAG: hypothetical protein AUJ98_04585 [Bacteroidetes bacterium CG2_30_33_31]